MTVVFAMVNDAAPGAGVLSLGITVTALLLAACLLHVGLGRAGRVLSISSMWNAVLIALVVLPILVVVVPRVAISSDETLGARPFVT